MNTKNILLIIGGICMIVGFAAGDLPPTHISNEETGECRYYFAGDERRFNEIPDGTWAIVGILGEYGGNRSICQEFCTYYTVHEPQGKIWKGLTCDCMGAGEEGCTNWCKIKDGEWVKDESRCVCPLGTEWDSFEMRCVEDLDYAGDVTSCSKEISSIIIKLGGIERKLNQSQRSRDYLSEQFKKLKEGFANLKENRNDSEALGESINKVDWALSELDMSMTDSDATGGALGEVSVLRKALSKYGSGEEMIIETTAPGTETTVPEQAESPDDSTLWIGLAIIVIVTLAGIYYVSRK